MVWISPTSLIPLWVLGKAAFLKCEELNTCLRNIKTLWALQNTEKDLTAVSCKHLVHRNMLILYVESHLTVWPRLVISLQSCRPPVAWEDGHNPSLKCPSVSVIIRFQIALKHKVWESLLSSGIPIWWTKKKEQNPSKNNNKNMDKNLKCLHISLLFWLQRCRKTCSQLTDSSRMI